MKIFAAIFIYVLLNSFTNAICQIGGKAFQFLDMTNSARVAALGGKSVAIHDDDLNIAYYNPSIVSEGMSNQFELNCGR